MQVSFLVPVRLVNYYQAHLVLFKFFRRRKRSVCHSGVRIVLKLIKYRNIMRFTRAPLQPSLMLLNQDSGKRTDVLNGRLEELLIFEIQKDG
jgi:hypothetical protein